jgi:hypothetical protein
MHIHLYDVVLFAHIALAIGSFIVAAGMHLAMAQLRGARTVTQMRAPARLLHRTGSLFPLFAIALAGFGALLLHLSGGQFGWSDGWVITAAATLASVEAVGALVLGPRGKRLGMLIGTSEGEAISPGLHRARLDPVTWLAAHGASGAVVGIVFLMTTKPPGAIAPLVILVTAGLGAATALPFTRDPGKGPAAAETTGPAAPAQRDHPPQRRTLAHH